MREPNIIVPPFSMKYKNELYVVSYSHDAEENGEDRAYLKREHILTGEEKVFPIENYGSGSGKEHLKGTIEEVMSKAYVEELFSLVFDILIEDLEKIFMREKK